MYLNFTIIAKKWSRYVSHWESAERKLMKLQIIYHHDLGVKRKIKNILIAIFFLALSKFYDNISVIMINIFQLPVEHNLGIASGLYLSKSCWNVQSAEEAYFRKSFTDFFSVFKFNVYLGFLAQIINVFWWDLLIIYSNNFSANDFIISFIMILLHHNLALLLGISSMFTS